MTIAMTTRTSPRIVEVSVTGRLTIEDYQTFLPQMEEAISNSGQVRILLKLQDFHGWDLKAAWEDFQFGIRHYRDIERLAVVGDQRWERIMALLFKPFTLGEVRYFDATQISEAQEWIETDLVASTPPTNTE